MRLNKDASRWHRLWSMRATIFWAGLNGAVCSLDVFTSTAFVANHPFVFMWANVIGFVVIGIARVTSQPGLK